MVKEDTRKSIPCHLGSQGFLALPFAYKSSLGLKKSQYRICAGQTFLNYKKY
jgi:hypothetical protein